MRKLMDEKLKMLELLTDLVKEENSRQLVKWGVQVRTPFEWLAYLTEEVGELSQAISEEYYRKGNNTQVRDEAIQVATLALKIAEMYVFSDVRRKCRWPEPVDLNKPAFLRRIMDAPEPR